MNWNPSDLARCIRVHPWRENGATEIADHETPIRGETYRVEAVMLIGGSPALYLEGFAGWFESCEFVKVPPAVEAAVNREAVAAPGETEG